ncbi:MAG: spore cortex biosynthesis protein YabQ [Clostridia bacterium]|nr:spore cortex biosynthesis protein YabQ [Clostridia bacterium]
MENQAYLFTIFILDGFLIGVLFDIFRILRKSYKTNDIITYIEDILFWLITASIILYSIFKFNNGELRGFIFIGLGLGTAIYILLFSKIFIKINLFIINIIKKVTYYIIVIPLKVLFNITNKTVLEPISFIVINLKKTLSKIILKAKSVYNKKKKNEYKKDLI